MRNGYHILRPGVSGLFLGASVAVAGWFSPLAFADNSSANMQIKATVKSSCNVSVDQATVDLGEISSHAFEGKQAGVELGVSEGSFNVLANCSGTSEYELTFTAAGNETSCIAATSKNMQFCLYEDSNKLDFSGASTTLQGVQAIETRNIIVKPAAGEALPEIGEHSAALVVTIAPK